MDPISIITLLISSGLLTEVLKFIVAKFGHKIPKNVNPLISAVLAESLNVLSATDVAQGVGVPALGVDPMAALVTGLASTGGHQLLFAHKYARTDKSASSTDIKTVIPLVPIMLFLAGCSVSEKVGDKIFVQTDAGCHGLAIMSEAIAGTKTDVDKLGPEGVRSYVLLQGAIHALGKNCQSSPQ